jgi:ppGpp synthetase/RelA/SpoT-type nucleotidyltranferase
VFVERIQEMSDVPDWKAWYEEQRPVYERLSQKLHDLLTELLKNADIDADIESRPKKVDSFLAKLNSPGKSYRNPPTEITDLAGIRVILRVTSDVERVAEIINREFFVDREKSVNKLNLLQANEFGYLSQHYIVRVKEPRSTLAEWRGLSAHCAEVQVRTILQHAWATIAHSIDYKSEIDIPRELRRRFFRLSALFELADDELNNIVRDGEQLFKQYKDKIAVNKSDIEINVDSLKAYLETSKNVTDWASYIESLGIRIGSIGMISRDVKMAAKAGITSIAAIELLLEQSKDWGKSYLNEFYKSTFGKPAPSKHSTDKNGIVTLLLIGNFPEIFTDEVLEKEFGFGMPERATSPARKFNPRITRT